MKSLKMYMGILLLSVSSGVLGQGGDDLFMAVTKSGTAGYILKSTDNGKTLSTVWDSEMQAQTGQNRLFDICYGDGKLVAVGNIVLTSENNGNTWKENSLYTYTGSNTFANKNALTCITYGNGFFVAAGMFHVIYSRDGINWKYVRTGELSVAEKSALKNPSGLSLEDIKKDPSLAGKRPSKGEFPPEITPGLKTPMDIIYAKDRFYLVGGNGAMEGKVFKIDGDAIVPDKDLSFSGNASRLDTGGLKTIKWDGKNTLVACSNSTKSAYSTDMGETWNYIFNPEKNQIWGLACNNGTWVAASPFEDIFISSDINAQWTKSYKRGGGRLPVQDMIYANGRYILVGSNATVITTTDLENWESNDASQLNGYHIHGITSVSEAKTTGSAEASPINEKWKPYHFKNQEMHISYTASVFSKGTEKETKTAKNEIQLVSAEGTEKIIFSTRRLTSGAYKSRDKQLETIVNTYKKAAGNGKVETTRQTYNGIEGLRVSYTSSTGTKMTTFNAVNNNDLLIIIACANMNEADAEAAISSFKLN